MRPTKLLAVMVLSGCSGELAPRRPAIAAVPEAPRTLATGQPACGNLFVKPWQECVITRQPDGALTVALMSRLPR